MVGDAGAQQRTQVCGRRRVTTGGRERRGGGYRTAQRSPRAFSSLELGFGDVARSEAAPHATHVNGLALPAFVQQFPGPREGV